MKCEYCGQDNNGIYGSGRFCNKKCARGFSGSKYDKNLFKNANCTRCGKEIKIRKRASTGKCEDCLKTRIRKVGPLLSKTCVNCKKDFLSHNKKTRFCSPRCVGSIKKPGNGGLRSRSGFCKVYLYESKIAGNIKLNKEEIEVAKILDLLNLKWKRNNNGFEYVDLFGKKRKYHPDFYIKDFDVYLEYKGYVTYEMSYKMKEAKRLNKFKLLIMYSNSPRYKDLGLNIGQISKDPNLLLECLKIAS